MEHGKHLIALYIFALSVAAGCDYIDFAGAIIPGESAGRRFEDSMIWNETHPRHKLDVPADNYSLIFIADIHVGTTVNLDKVISTAMKSDVSALVMAGDLTNGNEYQYLLLKDHMPHPDSLRVFPIAGNHDLNFDGWRHYKSVFGSSTYIFEITTPADSDLYICLENGSATLGKKQMDWLRNTLETRRSYYRNCVVTMHTDFFRFDFSEASNPLPEEIAALLDLFIRHDVNMVITGHDHRKNETGFGNTKFIVLNPLKDGNKNAGYFKLDVTGGKIQYRFIDL